MNPVSEHELSNVGPNVLCKAVTTYELPLLARHYCALATLRIGGQVLCAEATRKVLVLVDTGDGPQRPLRGDERDPNGVLDLLNVSTVDEFADFCWIWIRWICVLSIPEFSTSKPSMRNSAQ